MVSTRQRNLCVHLNTGFRSVRARLTNWPEIDVKVWTAGSGLWARGTVKRSYTGVKNIKSSKAGGATHTGKKIKTRRAEKMVTTKSSVTNRNFGGDGRALL